MRSGIICYFIDHSVEIKEQQNIHAFAVVDWLTSSEQDFGYRNTLSVWFAKILGMMDKISLPIQRIHCKLLSADKLYSGQKYLVMTLICRRILL